MPDARDVPVEFASAGVPADQRNRRGDLSLLWGRVPPGRASQLNSEKNKIKSIKFRNCLLISIKVVFNSKIAHFYQEKFYKKIFTKLCKIF
jgi:hypothetical protein